MASTAWMELKSITLNNGTEPPARLSPSGASDEYVAARLELLDKERELRDHIREVAAARNELPRGPVMPEYVFEAEGPIAQPTLLDLFGDRDQLLVYHLMFHPDDDQSCAMCAMWVDGLHGVAHHLATAASFVVIGKAPLDKLRSWAQHRGWDGLRVASSYGNSFNVDMGIEGEHGGQWPGLSTFERDGDEVRHVFTQIAPLPDGANGGIDLLSPMWHALDLLPSGRGDWLPDNDYPGRAR